MRSIQVSITVGDRFTTQGTVQFANPIRRHHLTEVTDEGTAIRETLQHVRQLLKTMLRDQQHETVMAALKADPGGAYMFNDCK